MKSFSLFGWTLVRTYELNIFRECAMQAAKVYVLQKHLAQHQELEPLWKYIKDNEFREDAETAVLAYKASKDQKMIELKINESARDLDGVPV